MHPALTRLARVAVSESKSAHPASLSRHPEEAEHDCWSLILSADPRARVHLAHATAALGQSPVAVADLTAARQELLRRRSHPAVVVLDADTRNALGLIDGLRARHDTPIVVCGQRGSGHVRNPGALADGFVAKPLEMAKTVAELGATVRRSPAQRLAIRRARHSLAAEG